MLRFLAVLAVAGALFASAFAAAAQLNVQGGSVQAGTDTTLSCAKSPVNVVAYAINTYMDSGDTEGLDWVTVQLTPSDASTCAGNDLTGALDLTGGSHAYLGFYPGFVDGTIAEEQSYPPSNSAVKIKAGQTTYRLAAYARDWTTRVWPLAENIEGIKLWVGGPAQGN